MMKRVVFALLVVMMGMHVEGRCNVKTKTAMNCQLVCSYMKNCDAWTWNSNSKQCFPKAATGWRSNTRSKFVSGTKHSSQYLNNVNFFGGDLQFPPC